VQSTYRPPEVGDLDAAVRTEQEVLGLEVAVDDALAVALRQAHRDLPDVARGDGLIEAAHLLEQRIELTAAGVLQHDVDARGIVEVGVKPDDVRVHEAGLDLDLTRQLLLQARVLEFGLLHDLDRADKVRRLLAGQEDRAQLAAAQRFADGEVGQRPVLQLAVRGPKDLFGALR
jgi:hypothetical protein